MKERDGCLIRSQRAPLVPTLLVNSCVILDKSLHLSGLQAYLWSTKGLINLVLLTAQILESREIWN